MSLSRVGFFAFALATTISCTRNVEDQTKISLNLDSAFSSQKVGALTVDEIRRIVVNVTAPDMQKPVVYFWSSPCDDGPCSQLPPSEITLQVAAGSSRLVQVLVIGQDNTSETLAFSYGEKAADLKAGANAVEVTVVPSGSATAREGAISGQYVESVVASFGYGPSGIIDVVYSPSATSPSIVVDSTEIINGWFSVVGLSGTPLKYRLRSTGAFLQYSGQDMTFDAIYDDVFANPEDRNYISIFSSPNIFWVEDSVGQPRRNQSGGLYALGFFGPAVSSFSSPASVCYKETLSPGGVFWNDEVSGTELTYSINTSDNEDIQRKGGGVQDYSPNMAICQIPLATEKYRTILPLDLANLRNGKNSLSGIQAPFAHKYYTQCGMNFTDFGVGCYNSMMNTVSLYWNYIPNIINSGAVSGVTVFTKKHNGECDDDCREQFRIPSSDGIRCGELESLGFSATGPDLTDEASNSYTGDMTLNASESLIAIICPFKTAGGAKTYLTSGLQIHGNLQAPPPPFTGLKIETPNDLQEDGFLAEASTYTSGVTVLWDSVPGTDVYEVNIKSGGTSIPECQVNTNGTSFNYAASGGVSTCAYVLQYNFADGTYLEFEVIAKDAGGQTLRQGLLTFQIMRIVPTFTALNSLTCYESGGNIVFAFNLSTSNTADMVKLNVRYGAGYSQSFASSEFVVSSGTVNVPVWIAAIPPFASTAMKIDFTLRQSNNWISPVLATRDVNYVWNGSTGSCTLL